MRTMEEQASPQGKVHVTSVESGSDISDMIERSGCSIPYYKLEECLGDNDRDFRKCKEVVTELRKCYEEKQAPKQAS